MRSRAPSRSVRCRRRGYLPWRLCSEPASPRLSDLFRSFATAEEHSVMVCATLVVATRLRTIQMTWSVLATIFSFQPIVCLSSILRPLHGDVLRATSSGGQCFDAKEFTISGLISALRSLSDIRVTGTSDISAKTKRLTCVASAGPTSLATSEDLKKRIALARVGWL